jgi:hypothetical protein
LGTNRAQYKKFLETPHTVTSGVLCKKDRDATIKKSGHNLRFTVPKVIGIFLVQIRPTYPSNLKGDRTYTQLKENEKIEITM